MPSGQSILVVGGGIFGVTSSLELARRGHSVTLIDPGPIPHPWAASTDINKAVRMDYGADELYMSLMEEAFVIWDKWNAEWPEPLYHQDGFLVLAREEIQEGFEYESLKLLQKHGHAVQRLNPATLKDRFPAWNSARYKDGYFNPRAGWAESGKVVECLIQQASDAGVSLRQNVTVTALDETDNKIAGVIGSNGEHYPADLVILATGTWSPLLAGRLKDTVTSLAQPIFYFRPEKPELFRPDKFPVFAADLSRTGWYGFPANADGLVKISNHGPGRKVHPDDAREINTEDLNNCFHFLTESLPTLANSPLVSTRTCLYCDSWDGHFYIDHDPEVPGLVYATGGSGHAFKFAPVLGGLVADIAERKQNPFASRFAWRARGAVSVKEQARFNG